MDHKSRKEFKCRRTLQKRTTKPAGNEGHRRIRSQKFDIPLLGTEDETGMFPVEILTCILARLPNKTLGRFQLVSKWWHNHITSPDFAAAVGKQRSSVTISTNYLLIIQYPTHCGSIELDNAEKCNFVMKSYIPHSKNSRIVGSSNGIVCLKTSGNRLFLSNPTTGSRLDLPASPDRPLPCVIRGLTIYNRVKFGFGYDSDNLDYKVWRITVSSLPGSGFPSAFTGMVYSLKSSRWTTISEFPTSISDIYSDNGVFCNEHLHWVARVEDNQGEAILGFGITGGSCHVLPKRDVSHSRYGWPETGMSLGVLKGCLCVGYSLRFWVMRVYGVKESWAELCHMNDDIDRIFDYASFSNMRPLIYSKNGGQVLFEVANCWLIWYDLKSSSIIKCVPFTGVAAEVCAQTMTLPRLQITS